jgi:hypothetical protein
LDIDVLSAKEFFGSLYGQLFYRIHILTSATDTCRLRNFQKQ